MNPEGSAGGEAGRQTDEATDFRSPEATSLDALVGLLAEMEVEGPGSTSAFYDRVCEALCRLTSLERAGLMLYDPIRGAATVVGHYGIDPGWVPSIQATLEETPMAQRALATGEVVVVNGDLHGHVPDRYADMVDRASMACGPVAAGGHWFGVIVADWNWAEKDLTESERQTMRALGRLAALAGSVERATRQHERAGLLNERISLIREIHDQVIQRLFGLSLVLGSGQVLSEEELARCADEIKTVLSELRAALGRPLTGMGPPPQQTLREILDSQARASGLTIHWPEDATIPMELEPLAQSFAVEALRNAQRHADAESIEITVSRSEQALELTIINDGVGKGDSGSGAGLGLRLLTLEALQHNGLVEFGPLDGDRWRARLLVPVKGQAEPHPEA